MYALDGSIAPRAGRRGARGLYEIMPPSISLNSFFKGISIIFFLKFSTRRRTSMCPRKSRDRPFIHSYVVCESGLATIKFGVDARERQKIKKSNLKKNCM